MLTDPAAAEVSLTELLAERVAAQARADAWYAHQDAQAHRLRQISTLYDVARDDRVDELLGDQRAGEALRFLVGRQAREWMDDEPDLAAAVLAWWADQDVDTAPVRAALLTRHRQLWTEHARTLLGAGEHLTAADPHLAVYARTLQDGRLLSEGQLATLAEAPKRTREQVQTTALRDYPDRRDEAVRAHWAALSWVARRRTTVDELAAAYDAEHLVVCDLCGTASPRPDLDDPEDDDAFYGRDGCHACGTGHRRVDYAHRDQVPTLTQRLDEIRAQLRRPGPARA
jgi:hypothetical protein